MNDSAGMVFTDTLPLLSSAYRALQRELAENGVSVLVEQQDIELDLNGSTGTTNSEISDVSRPQLPTDCLMPHMLWEPRDGEYCRCACPLENVMKKSFRN